MSISPIITFKAGTCEVDVSFSHTYSHFLPSNSNIQTNHKPFNVIPLAKPGYIYLYSEDGKDDSNVMFKYTTDLLRLDSLLLARA
jgi:hypothetical protein